MSNARKLPPKTPNMHPGAGQQPDKRGAHRPTILQPKAAATTAHLKRPAAAPPVYRPQPVPKVLQPKTARPNQPLNQFKPAAHQPKLAPAAPPVYRPQPVPRVLQLKKAGSQQPPASAQPRGPIAPPVYRPQQKKIVQPKVALQQRRQPVAPSIYRPEQQRTIQQTPQTKRQNLPGAAQPSRPAPLKPASLSLQRSVQANARALARRGQAGVLQRKIGFPEKNELVEAAVKDKEGIKTHITQMVHGIISEVNTVLSPHADVVDEATKSRTGTNLKQQTLTDLAMTYNGWADIQGYVRELTLGSSYAKSGDVTMLNPSKKADALYNYNEMTVAYQMKTVTSMDNVTTAENLPKAVGQLQGKGGEHPPDGAMKVVDIGVSAPEAAPPSPETVLKRAEEVVEFGAEAKADFIIIRVPIGTRDAINGVVRYFINMRTRKVSAELTLAPRGPAGKDWTTELERSLPGRTPVAYPETYPGKYKAGPHATIEELADDAKMLMLAYNDITKERPKVAIPKAKPSAAASAPVKVKKPAPSSEEIAEMRKKKLAAQAAKVQADGDSD